MVPFRCSLGCLIQRMKLYLKNLVAKEIPTKHLMLAGGQDISTRLNYIKCKIVGGNFDSGEKLDKFSTL